MLRAIIRYVEINDPQLLQLQTAVKTIIVASILMAIFYFRPTQQGTTLFLTGIFVMQAFIGDSLRYRIISILVVSFVCIFGVFVFTLLGQHAWSYALGLAVAAFIIFYLRKLGMYISIAGGFVLFILLLSGGFPGDFTIAFERLINASIAAGVAILVALLVWPYRPRKLLAKLLLSNVMMLRECFAGIFFDFLTGAEGNPQASYYKNRVNSRLKQARVWLQIYPDKALQTRFRKQLYIFSLAVALNNLFNSPSHSKVFFTLVEQIKLIQQAIHNVLSSTDPEKQAVALIKLDKSLLEVNQAAVKHEDVASFFFIVNQIIKILKQREIDE